MDFLLYEKYKKRKLSIFAKLFLEVSKCAMHTEFFVWERFVKNVLKLKVFLEEETN